MRMTWGRHRRGSTPMFIRKLLEAISEENGLGRGPHGELNELVGVRGGRAWALEKKRASELQRPLWGAFSRAFSGIKKMLASWGRASGKYPPTSQRL